MAEAVILFGGIVKRTTHLSELRFNHRSGFLADFKFKGVKYTHMDKADFREENERSKYDIKDYYHEGDFLRYLHKEIDRSEVGVLSLDDLDNAMPHDRISIKKLRVISPYTDFCKVDIYSWDYDPALPVLENAEIAIPASKTMTTETVPVGNTAQLFYANKVAIVLSATAIQDKATAAYWVTLMALRIEQIEKDIFPLFNNDTGLQAYKTAQVNEWINTTVFGDPTLSILRAYYTDLSNYYKNAYANQLAIANAATGEKLYFLAGALSASGLSVIPVSEKLRLLETIANNYVIKAAMASVNLLMNPAAMFLLLSKDSDEKLILKILESVSYVPSQITVFLEGLTRTAFQLFNKPVTLYRFLFYKLDDFLGPDRFTAFARAIHKLVMLNNGITNNTDKANLHLADKHFFWNTEPLAPGTKIGLVEYDITDDPSGQNIIIERKVCIEGRYVTVRTADGNETEWRATKFAYSTITLGHFDLISLNFISKATFLDTENPGDFEATTFVTYAGYLDYILEKKGTDEVLEITTNVLVGLSFIAGAGELAFALEVGSMSRALLATWSLVNTVSGVVIEDPDFEAWVTEKFGPEAYETIRLINIFSSGLELGVSIVQIVKAAKYVALAKEIEALPRPSILHLTDEEIDAMIETRKRLEAELITHGKITTIELEVARLATLKRLLPYEDIVNALEELSDSSRLRFLDDFADISDDFILRLDQNPDFVAHWDSLSDAEKAAFRLDKPGNFSTWYKLKIEDIAAARFRTDDWMDIAKNKPYARHELETFAEVEIIYRTTLRRSLKTEAGDAIATSGIPNGKSFDAFGTPKSAFQEDSWVYRYDEQYTLLLRGIDKHFKKIVTPPPGKPPLDVFVLDLKNYDSPLRTNIINYINDPGYKYHTLINTAHFRTIN